MEMSLFLVGRGALGVGDVVTVLLGADVPFVLRKVEQAERTLSHIMSWSIFSLIDWKADKIKEPRDRHVDLRDLI